MNTPCRFCGVLPEYGHFEWCKVTRAPTAEEVLAALIEENERSVDEGPSADLTAIAHACLRVPQPFKSELTECRSLLADLLTLTPTTEEQRKAVKAAADWLADWDGKRL